MTKKLIINADDFGYSRGVNYGIIDAYQLGVLTSTTIMAGMPGFDHAIKLAKENPKLGVGVHLTLTFGTPCTNGLQVIAKNNQFNYINPNETDNLIIEPSEVERELTAQIEKVYAAGIRPTHLDSHHHVHKEIGVNKIVQRLAKKYKLPIRWGYDSHRALTDISYVDKLILDFDEVIAQATEPVDNDLGEVNSYINQLITNIQQSDFQIFELMTHPGYSDHYLSNHSSMSQVRKKEVAVLISPLLGEKLVKADIELVTYAALGYNR